MDEINIDQRKILFEKSGEEIKEILTSTHTFVTELLSNPEGKDFLNSINLFQIFINSPLLDIKLNSLVSPEGESTILDILMKNISRANYFLSILTQYISTVDPRLVNFSHTDKTIDGSRILEIPLVSDILNFTLDLFSINVRLKNELFPTVYKIDGIGLITYDKSVIVTELYKYLNSKDDEDVN